MRTIYKGIYVFGILFRYEGKEFPTYVWGKNPFDVCRRVSRHDSVFRIRIRRSVYFKR